MLPIEGAHALHQHLLGVEGPLEGLLFRLRLGDVKGDLQPGVPALPLQQPVFEQVVPLGDGVGVLPGVGLTCTVFRISELHQP